MKTLFNEFFYVPEDGKIREKVMMARITISVVFMVMCLAAMSFTAYAYFTCSVSSNLNTIQSAYYSLEITDSSKAVVTGAYTCSAVENDLHTFTLTPNGTAETGYCKIEISNGQGTKTYYYTTQIFKNTEENTGRLTELTLTIQAAKGCVITFTPQWGTSANYAVNQKELYGVVGKTTIYHSSTPEENPPSTSGENENDAPQRENADQLNESQEAVVPSTGGDVSGDMPEQVQPNSSDTEEVETDTETKTETETEAENEVEKESENEVENTPEESESTDMTTDDTESDSPTTTDTKSQEQPEVPEGV